LILSQEIASIAGREETDSPEKDIVIGRRGCYKSHWNIKTAESHAYDTNVPDAFLKGAELLTIMSGRFASRHTIRKILGEESFDTRDFGNPGQRGEFDSNPSHLEAIVRISLVDTTIEQARNWHNTEFERVVKDLGWKLPEESEEQWVTADPSDSGITQYPSFTISQRDPLMQACTKGTKEFYRDHVYEDTKIRFVGGMAHGDENLYFAALKERSGKAVPIYGLPYRGRNPHKGTEFAYAESVFDASGCIEWIINKSLPEYIVKEVDKKETPPEQDDNTAPVE